jgi:hypothetical protein
VRHSAQKTQNNHRTAAKRHAREIKTVANHALALHRAPALFLQIATEFATIGSMSSPSQPIRLNAEDKLAALRRLDKGRAWKSLDDQLYCTICKKVISGRQIEVAGGTNGLRALRLKCSTAGCFSTPADWLVPVKSDTVPKIGFFFGDDGA